MAPQMDLKLLAFVHPATRGQRGDASGPAEAGGPAGARTVDLTTYLLIREVRCEFRCEQRCDLFKPRASVTYSMRTMRDMHRSEHRKRQEATVVARAYLLVHYC